jgi:threonine dehydrogenase-like Zn-dependent dehydrogenase
MSTGHHAATVAGVKKGDTVAVVGDGAVGLCAILAASRLGAERVIALSRHADRQEIARKFGIVGVPHGQPPFAGAFFRNTGWRGGPAPARIYIPELLGDVLEGVINPGRVFDYETDLDHIADAYQAMNERRAIKSLVRIGAI